jgi:hypothetical protein
MLLLVEKILFGFAVAATLVAAWFAVKRLGGLISGGQGKPDWKVIPGRLWKVLAKYFSWHGGVGFWFLSARECSGCGARLHPRL